MYIHTTQKTSTSYRDTAKAERHAGFRWAVGGTRVLYMRPVLRVSKLDNVKWTTGGTSCRKGS